MNQTIGMMKPRASWLNWWAGWRMGWLKTLYPGRRGRPMAMLISVEEYEQLREQASAETRVKTLPWSPELQQRQKLLVERALYQSRYGDPVAGLAKLFSTLPPSEDDFWLEIQDI